MANTKKYSSSFWRFHLPAMLYAVLIFVLSSLPSLSPPDLGFEPQDKLYHFLFYIPFGFLLAGSLDHQKVWLPGSKRYLGFAIFLGALYGLSDEIHQYFVPGRMMSLWDFLADSLGVLTGAWIYRLRSRTGSRLWPGKNVR